MAKPFSLYVPSMWENIMADVTASNREFRNAVSKKKLNVTLTGVLDSFYKSLKSDREDHISLFILPVAHCALNITQHSLQIIGPAISTRNDIFLFRRIGRSEKRELPFIVGTKEVDLTSSNVFRVSAFKWSHDMFFYSGKGSLPSSLLDRSRGVRADLLNDIKCEAEDDASDRFLRLLDGTYDAAVFMGEELTVTHPETGDRGSIFQMPGVVDVMNLNMAMNNIYETQFLPRAVICTRQSDSPWHRRSIDQFSEIYNQAVIDYRMKAAPASERSQQKPLCIGKKAEIGDIDTLINFTIDMHTYPVTKWRKRDTIAKEFRSSRALRRSDFFHWNCLYFETIRDALCKRLQSVYHALGPSGRMAGRNAKFLDLVKSSLDSMGEIPNGPEGLEGWLRSLGKDEGITEIDAFADAARHAMQALDALSLEERSHD